jgi:phosphoribosylamine---glycine ligase
MKKYTVLVVDGGGRGATVIHAYAKSPHVKKLIAVPGNDLMQINTKKPVKTYQYITTTNVPEIIKICQKEKVDFVDVTQDDAIEAGVVNAVRKLGIPVLGPTKEAGQIEWDKAWSRNFMKKYKLPIPQYHVFQNETEGISFLKKSPNRSWFIKASGLALGKGVIAAENNKDAIEKIKLMKNFGNAGKTFLIEEALVGEEFTAFALCSGKDFVLLGNAQDHKRMFNYDEGENTGGMGCSTPPLLLTPPLMKKVEKIITQTLAGLMKEGRPYTGILYLGGMVVKNDVYIIEFNARWGEPESEVIVTGIKNDFFELCYKASQGKLTKIKTDGKSRVVVTLALRKNPTGDVARRKIYGIEDVKKMPGVIMYGTRVKKEKSGYSVPSGRLLYVVGEGKNIIEARKKAYEAASVLFVEGNNLHYRTDIGWRDVVRLRS